MAARIEALLVSGDVVTLWRPILAEQVDALPGAARLFVFNLPLSGTIGDEWRTLDDIIDRAANESSLADRPSVVSALFYLESVGAADERRNGEEWRLRPKALLRLLRSLIRIREEQHGPAPEAPDWLGEAIDREDYKPSEKEITGLVRRLLNDRERRERYADLMELPASPL